MFWFFNIEYLPILYLVGFFLILYILSKAKQNKVETRKDLLSCDTGVVFFDNVTISGDSQYGWKSYMIFANKCKVAIQQNCLYVFPEKFGFMNALWDLPVINSTFWQINLTMASWNQMTLKASKKIWLGNETQILYLKCKDRNETIQLFEQCSKALLSDNIS